MHPMSAPAWVIFCLIACAADAGQPDSIAHLRSSGIFPEQGPLGEGQEALQRLSYSSSASAASMAQRAQRLDDEAMLYMSHSSSNDSARTGRLGGDLPLHPMKTSSDSSAHPFQISLEDGMPARNAPCAAETAIPVGPLQAQMCFRGGSTSSKLRMRVHKLVSI